ncbi:MAG: GNAT family N-acetyltransferase [Spirosomataceae bacterium]
MLIIEDVPWDSAFFGYKVGKITVNAPITAPLAPILHENNTYRLIYIFSVRELTEPIPGCPLIDRKIMLHQSIPAESDTPCSAVRIVPFDPDQDDFEALKQLALLSGTYSRFNTDKNFSENEYVKLYSQWIYGSVYEHTSFCILTAKQGQVISGFVTLEKKTTALCAIGLLAVSPSARGTGVGVALVQEAIKKARAYGFTEIQVITQGANTAAMRLYLKTGFRVLSTTFIYHYRNV